MRIYLLVAISLLMRMARCSASGTTLMIGAPGPCGSCPHASSQFSWIWGIQTPGQLSFQGVHPVMFSISPLTNLRNCAWRAGSSSGFLMGLVYAGGALPPPLSPLFIPGVLDPRRMVADNMCLLKETLLNRIVDWSTDQSGRDVGRLEFLLKKLDHLGFLPLQLFLELYQALLRGWEVSPWSDNCDLQLSDEELWFYGWIQQYLVILVSWE